MLALQLQVQRIGQDSRVYGEEERKDDRECKARLWQALFETEGATRKRQCGDQENRQSRGFHEGSEDGCRDNYEESTEIQVNSDAEFAQQALHQARPWRGGRSSNCSCRSLFLFYRFDLLCRSYCLAYQ